VRLVQVGAQDEEGEEDGREADRALVPRVRVGAGLVEDEREEGAHERRRHLEEDHQVAEGERAHRPLERWRQGLTHRHPQA
jgi:hypothetical protein